MLLPELWIEQLGNVENLDAVSALLDMLAGVRYAAGPFYDQAGRFNLD
jgi:hypothetical protein